MDDVIRIEVDGDGTIVGVDDAAVALLDVESDLLAGRHVAEIVNVNDRERFVDRFGFDGGRLPSDAAPLVVRLVDHRERSIWVEVLPLADADAGNVGTLILSARAFRRGEPLGIDMADPDPYHALVQRSADIVMTVDPEGTVRFANTAMVRLLGMEPDDLVDTQILDIVHPDDHDSLTDLVVRLLEHPAEPCAFEFRARHADGTYRWIDGWLQNLLDHPEVGGLLGNGRDVTDRHHTQAKLAASEERFRSLASSSPSAIFELDAAGHVLFANDRWRHVTGRDVTDTAEVFDVLLPSDAQRLRRMWAAGAARTGLDEDVQVVRPDGEVRWVELRTRPVLDADTDTETDADGAAPTHVGSLHDVTEIRRAHADLEHLALHDPLTDLPNRALLLDRLESAVDEVTGGDDLLALLFVDLDRFKVVNDSLGHHAGDEVLVAVAERLTDLVRPTDLVARFGGDEFVVLCEPIVDADQVVALADRIRREVAGGVDVGGETVHVSVSVGVVIGNGNSLPEELLRDADAAMYAAKTRGRDRALVFDETMHRAAVERLSVETGLRRALERDEFRLYFQPIVDVDSGDAVAVEALVRWQHPERGLLEPADFLSVAEESGLLRDLGAWILDRACRTAAVWPVPASGPTPALFVNLAAAQLARFDLVETVRQVVADTGFEATRLVLEVTEGMLMTGASETAELLSALRELGARIAIDDFGTGYSSLSYLTRLPVDVLKIDQSFVSGLAESPKDREVTGAIIALAHALGLATVAEGVEHAGQLAALGELGCDLAQGYWFSPAVPGDEVAAVFHA